MQKVLEVAAHYFRICLNGHWPSHDFVGAPYSDGTVRGQMSGRPLFNYKGETFFGVLTEISADLDEFAKSFGLPHYRAAYPCLRCFCPLSKLDDLARESRKRTHQWVMDSAEGALKFFNVDDGIVPDVLASVEGKKKRGGLVVTDTTLAGQIPGIRKWDRIEPAPHEFPDIVHGERCQDYDPSKRRMLVYRRDRNLLLFINRLFKLEGVTPGIPGLKLDHFIFDSMHVLELGVLTYLRASGCCRRPFGR